MGRRPAHTDASRGQAAAANRHTTGSSAAATDLWSPEDAFVAAAGSCLAVTIVAIAQHQQLPLNSLSVHADGVVGRRADGRFGFVRIEQTVTLETDAEHEAAARNVVAKAEDGCLVTVSLDLPVQTTVEVRTATAVT